MSSIAISSSPAAIGPVVRRQDTGCRVTLGAGLVPAAMSHNAKTCKCLPAQTTEDLERLAVSVRDAMSMDILCSEKPSLAVAMFILGAEVVY
ncbi:Uu.00g055220.m01.CDS01 [Anthostomella pinea]|uniref:Uu.00g055220.m01.CDS01 n=1 Tax=Anthostomella pinea TaxID=933095 RepID=A0AAI8VWS7_9PEZI|nr:Uu.00g055220.m01.CDS01 [Anthostomella pinea]